MTSKLTRDKAQWLHDACEEAAAAGIKLTMNPNELLMFTSYALAAMDSKPVGYADPMAFVNFETGNARREWMWKNPGADLVPLYADPRPEPASAEPVAWRYRTTDINGNPNPRWSFSEEASLMGLYQPLYTTPQPAPVSDCKPVAWLAIYHGEAYDDAIGITRSVVEAQVDRFGWEYGLTEIIPLYRHAQTAPERDQVRSEHAEWSQATFGNVGPVGPLKHLSKEALEAAAEPGDLSEWADMQFLLWDAQRCAGITDEQITQAMIEKLAVNKQREWPEPKDGEPRLHIKEQMVPVTQQEPIAWLNDAYLARGVVDGEAGSEDAGPGYIPVYRDPATQPEPVVPPMQHWEELCRQYPDMSIRDAIIRAAWWNHCRAAMLAAAPQDEAKKDKPHNNFGTGSRLTNHRFKV